MIKVTKTYLPELADYLKYIEKIWDTSWATNHGPIICELEERLKNYLDVKHLFVVNNGTTALQIAIKALGLKGEIITTPFSYVATTSSIVWENCTPVFVDIDQNSLCIDPEKIEAQITANTTAILAVHVYGNPCNVEKIQQLAEKYNLKIIYDAAHSFGVKYLDTSILNYGHISTLSFHATKLFHTVEGGAVITDDDLLAHKISYLRNFGHNGAEKFYGVGINGKNSEFHAAMGLCVLPKVNSIVVRRKEIFEIYDNIFTGTSSIKKPNIRDNTEYNFSYYPIIFENEPSLLKAVAILESQQIFPRRYFYPCLNTLPYVDSINMPIAEDISKRILCLPLYPELSDKEVKTIAELTLAALKDEKNFRKVAQQ